MFDDLINDLDATCLDAFGVPCLFKNPDTQQTVEGMVVIDKDVAVISDDGYSTLRQTHASFTQRTIPSKKGVEVITANGRYRLSSPISDDGSMAQWVVLPISNNDVQDAARLAGSLDSVINQEW